MRSLRLLLAPLALASPLAAGCRHDAPAVPKDAIAIVGDKAVTRDQYEALMSQARQSYEAKGQAFPRAGTSTYANLKVSAVRLLVEQAELEQKAPELGVTVDRSQVDARRRMLVEGAFGGSEMRYRARLREERMTDAQVRAALYAQLLSDAVSEAVTAGVTVSAAAVQRYYESHLPSYTDPRTRIVRHILVETKAVADRVYARLRSGESFAALARRFSRDERTRDRGGRLELVEGDAGVGLGETAFVLDTGALSRPFRTSFGWEIVQAVSAVRPGKMTPLADVRESIRRRLLDQRRRQRFAAWLTATHEEFAARTAYAEGFSPSDGR
jgi:foldase protein PrsA